MGFLVPCIAECEARTRTTACTFAALCWPSAHGGVPGRTANASCLSGAYIAASEQLLNESTQLSEIQTPDKPKPRCELLREKWLCRTVSCTVGKELLE